MHSGYSADPERLWQHLLSRDAGQVRAAFMLLSHEEKAAVLVHLNRMAEDPNWHPEQRKSATSALIALQSETGKASFRDA